MVLRILIGWFAAMVLCLPTVAAERVFPVASHGRGELRYVGEVPVAILRGTPEEIGEQHAALLAKPGAPLREYPKKLLAELGAEQLWPMVVVASKRLLMQSPARYQREIVAMTKDANFARDDIEVANSLLELRRLGCSALIVEPERSATGGPLFGRNFDMPGLGLLDRYGVVMVFQPEGQHAFVSIAFPAVLGVLSGMNDAGLAVATLDVERTADHSASFDPTGVPMAFVFRRILEECTTLDEAERLLKQVKATTHANLAVCDRDRSAVFEITTKTVARRGAEESILRCTNHFRIEGLSVGETCQRFDRLRRAYDHSSLDVEAVAGHLHDANQGKLTLQTMIFEPRELVLHLAMGQPPSSALPLQRIELAPLFAP